MVLVPIRWGRPFVALASASIMVLSLGVAAAPARAAVPNAINTSPPTLTGTNCLGGVKTVSWSPVPRALGYRIVEQWIGSSVPETLTVDVPRTQTTVQVPVEFARFGPVSVTLYWAQAQPRPPKPPVAPYVQFGFFVYLGLQTPHPIQWDTAHIGPSTEGDGTVTVSFAWIAPSINGFSGGQSSYLRVAVTASPGGQTIVSGVTDRQGGLGVTDTFSGLTNGVPYTFTSIASNECGSSGPVPSPPFTPRAAGGLYCVVTRLNLPPAVPKTEQWVQVLAADGLGAISHIQIVNGTVDVAGFTPGETSPVTVIATKSDPNQQTSWSFDMTDVNGRTKHCN